VELPRYAMPAGARYILGKLFHGTPPSGAAGDADA
jgi:hypothetical protein